MKVNSSLHESIIHYEMNYEIKNEFNNLQMTVSSIELFILDIMIAWMLWCFLFS